MLDPRRFPELLTPDEMGRADRLAIAGGTPGIVLMERAGAAVADEAARWIRSRGRIAVLCGPGGNGGDGFIAARLLAARGYRVAVGLLGERSGLRGDAAIAAERFSGPAASAGALDLAEADGVIDALFGAGLSRDLDGEALASVCRINAFARSGKPVVSVDVPSGLDGATGLVRGGAVEASVSVTFFRLKPGHLLAPGRALCGELRLADIGVPAGVLPAIAPNTHLNAPALWRAELPRLGPQSHKYSRGAALVLSGPAHQTGAARLAARTALRAGAGIVLLAAPRESVAVNAAQSTAVMVAPFEGRDGFEALLADERRTAVLIGPGAGVGAATRGLAAAGLAFGAARRAVVLDADALTSFAGDSAGLAVLVARGGRPAIVTPHAGEFARLFSEDKEIIEIKDKLAKSRAAARRLGAVVVLKGSDTVVAAPDGRATIGFDLPATLATAGSGDVLAGLICGLLAQGMAPFSAASTGVWLHGACARSLGAGLIAEDLPEALPGVLRGLAAP